MCERNGSIIQIYLPTTTSADDEVEELYDDLESALVVKQNSWDWGFWLPPGGSLIRARIVVGMTELCKNFIY